MGFFSWMTSGWSLLRQAATVIRDLAELKDVVAGLRAQVAALEKNAPPRPEDLKLRHGIYWGRPTESEPRQPYCPACCAEGTYTPLYRLGSGSFSGVVQVTYNCPKCHASFLIMPEREQQALNE